MKHISVLIKPASSLCNIRCKYCFYADISSLREVKSFGKMTEETAEKMIANIYLDLEDGDQLTLAFQGGEPTLAGLKYFKYITQLVEQEQKKVTVHYALQTNGMLINEKWCEFFKEYNFLVGISIDGTPDFHDLNRVNAKGDGTFQRVIKTKELFDKYQVEYNVLCVLTNQLAKEAKKVFAFIKEHNIRYVQFIPCMDELNAESRNGYALTPKRFASFYRMILRLWLEEFRNGNYISIKLFDDLVNLFVAREVTACGILGQCQIQYVIEADGGVYPCDFYVLDEYRLGNIREQRLRELYMNKRATAFLCERPKLSKFCETCPFQKACGGGCKRMKDAMYVAPTEDYCGYQDLLKHFVPKIEEILRIRERILQ